MTKTVVSAILGPAMNKAKSPATNPPKSALEIHILREVSQGRYNFILKLDLNTLEVTIVKILYFSEGMNILRVV